MSNAEIESLVLRLRELADAVTKGKEARDSEFTMSIPARPERDADLVLASAAAEIERLTAELATVRTLIEQMINSATVTEDGDHCVMHYTIKTGALHKLVGILEIPIPANLPVNTEIERLQALAEIERLNAIGRWGITHPEDVGYLGNKYEASEYAFDRFHASAAPTCGTFAKYTRVYNTMFAPGEPQYWEYDGEQWIPKNIFKDHCKFIDCYVDDLESSVGTGTGEPSLWEVIKSLFVKRKPE